ncbi:PrgI family protein [Patescibacteria group bacterium]|nr:PrgI family protein [Patescibacteria group bacterium]
MPEKFIVPQFIDNEDKILGPITVRQFLILLGACLTMFIEYRIFTLAYFILVALITAGLAGTFAFVKINGQPFHLFFLNALQTIVRPSLRTWDKNLHDGELRALMRGADQPTAPPAIVQKRPESTRLRDLTLVVNTGGVYRPEDDDVLH